MILYHVRLLGTMYPQKIHGLLQLIKHNDSFYCLYCDNCYHSNPNARPNPCNYRTMRAWRSMSGKLTCKHFDPIAVNHYAAEEARTLAHKFGLTLIQAVEFYVAEIGEAFRNRAILFGRDGDKRQKWEPLPKDRTYVKLFSPSCG